MSSSPVWRLRTTSIDLNRGVVMGVINATPDSFSDGGKYRLAAQAVAAGRDMFADGAQIVDVGGESTRPGALEVSEAEELDRVISIVEALAKEGPVSIDTSKPTVAQEAVGAGAEAINDVTSCSDPEMAPVMAATGAGVVLMHMQGTPRTMQVDPQYTDVVGEVTEYLASRAAALVETGVDPGRIALDPGLGFGKMLHHNLALLDGLSTIASLGYPVLVGASRKAFLGTLTGIEEPSERDGATAVITALAYERGARIFRVHEVPGSRVALAVAAAIVADQQWDEWSQDSNPGVSPG